MFLKSEMRDASISMTPLSWADEICVSMSPLKTERVIAININFKITPNFSRYSSKSFFFNFLQTFQRLWMAQFCCILIIREGSIIITFSLQ